MTSATIVTIIGDSMDHWWVITLTLKTYDSPRSTLTLVFAPSYRPIIDVTVTTGVPFFGFFHSYILHFVTGFLQIYKAQYDCFPPTFPVWTQCPLFPPSCVMPVFILLTATVLWWRLSGTLHTVLVICGTAAAAVRDVTLPSKIDIATHRPMAGRWFSDRSWMSWTF